MLATALRAEVAAYINQFAIRASRAFEWCPAAD